MPTLHDRVAATLAAAAPALGLNSADIKVVAVEDGIASVRLSRGCTSCAGGLPAVVAGLEAELRRQVPEVEVIEAVP